MPRQQENPFDRLEQAALRDRDAERGEKAVSKAMARIILGSGAGGSDQAKMAFFAMLALRLERRQDFNRKTAATDGKVLVYNPTFVTGLTRDETVGLLCHEVMHCASGHHTRRGDRQPKRWNVACDLAINGILREAGITLPQGGVFPGVGAYSDFEPGLSAEAYYSKLCEQGDGEQGDGDGDGGEGDGDSDDPGGCGGVMDAGKDSASLAESDADWRCAVAQAEAQASKHGQLPAGISRAADEIVHPAADWRELLRRFITMTARNDYSWSHPNRRFVGQGVYLPSARSEDCGTIVCCVDTSGSIGPDELGMFAQEMEGILQSVNARLKIYYHDVEVAGEADWSSNDGPLKLEPVGGGGTSHVPVFNKIAEGDDEPPSCVVCLTDGYTDYPDEATVGLPVLWAMTSEQVAPFGQTVKITP